MTEKLAEAIITSILNYGQQGIKDEAELTDKLESDFAGLEIDFGSFFEMMNTGVFRASFTMSYGQYPVGNLTEHAVVKTAFRMHWISQRGEKDYLERFAPKKRKWWQLR